MPDLIPFSYDDQQVRVVAIDGEPWFVLADLCRVLGIGEVSIVRRRLDDALCQTHPILDSLGRTQQATIVSEAGMYEVVIRSDKPEAVAFRRWITSEVLPSIRKTGSYQVPETREAILARSHLLALDMIREQDDKIAELEPAARAWDVLVQSTGSYSMADTAKILCNEHGLNIGRQRLFTLYAEWGWIFRGAGRDGQAWKAYQEQVDNGRLVEKANAAFQNSRTGEMEPAGPTIRVTPKGLGETLKRLNARVAA